MLPEPDREEIKKEMDELRRETGQDLECHLKLSVSPAMARRLKNK